MNRFDATRIIRSAEDVARQLYRDEGEERARLAHEVGMLRGNIRGLCASLQEYADPFSNRDKSEWVALLMWGNVPVPCLIDEDDFIVGCGINGEGVPFEDMPAAAQTELEATLRALVIRNQERAQAEAYAATL